MCRIILVVKLEGVLPGRCNRKDGNHHKGDKAGDDGHLEHPESLRH
jgi:hypothetical protein